MRAAGVAGAKYSKGKKALSINDIRNYYGSTKVETEERKQLKQA